MIQNCQQFERRIQHLMDSRIDPETDHSLCAHSEACVDCHESLMAYSFLHTSYLQDSDSMKIKLENLGLHEVFTRRSPLPRRSNRWFAVVASVAAMLLVCLGVLGSEWGKQLQKPEQPNAVAVAMNSPAEESSQLESLSSQNQISFNSLVRVHQNLDHHELYQYSTDLPGLRPLKAISYCLSWVQESWLGEGEGEAIDLKTEADKGDDKGDEAVEPSDVSDLQSTDEQEFAFINVLFL